MDRGNSDFAVYLAAKHRKLDEQLGQNPSGSVFAGCTVYITGHTEPSARILGELITKNGGKICPFYGSKGSATHVVAESLTARKNVLWADRQVAKPAWVVDSVKRGRLLPWTDYRTIGTNTVAATAEADYKAYILRERRHLNCLDPGFLAKYYKTSRLHFLSHSKRRLRLETLNIGKHTPASGPQVILHVDFDSFFVAAALKDRPDLKDKAVCVSHGSDSSDIASCNYVARTKGVKNGMWVGRAKEMCPELVCLDYDFDSYERYSAALYKALTDLEPDYICPVSVDEALVNITNCLQSSHFGLETLIVKLRETVLKATGLSVSVGAGPNVLLAKLALRQSKPNGYKIFNKVADAKLLVQDLPVEMLPGVGKMMLYRLGNLNVHLIKDVLKHTPEVLEREMGEAMTRKLISATNAHDTDDLTTLNAPPKSLGVDVGWGVRTLTSEEVHTFAGNVVRELWSRREPEMVFVAGFVKVYSMRNQDYYPPKYMGLGDCEVFTKKIGYSDSEQLLRAEVLAALETFNIKPLKFRGLGVQLRLGEPGPKQRRIQDFKTPTKPLKREMIALQPKRKHHTLTQMAVDDVDESVLDALPREIRNEIERFPSHFNVKVKSRPQHVSQKDTEAETYEPIDFMGSSSESDLRRMIRDWMQGFPEGPCLEDAMDFYLFLRSVLASDWNWLKAVSLVQWMALDAEGEWQYYVDMLERLIGGEDAMSDDGVEMEVELEAAQEEPAAAQGEEEVLSTQEGGVGASFEANLSIFPSPQNYPNSFDLSFSTPSP